MEREATCTRRRHQAAFTLVELIVAGGIATLVLAALAALTVFSARSVATVTNYVDLDQYSRKALDGMETRIRQANLLVSYNTNQLIFNYQGGVSNLSYTWSPLTRRLVCTNGSEVTILLKECDTLCFTIFGNLTVSNTFDQFVTTNATNAKLVRLDWKCSRLLYGRTNLTTESMQSAKIVIRNS